VGNYILRRMIYAFFTLIGVTVITFLVVYAVPADPVAVMAGPYADAATIASIKHQLGLDRPLPVQYGLYIWHALHGDWGTSYINQLPVLGQLLNRFPATIQLGLAAFLLQLLIGIPLGALAAAKQNSRLDNLLMSSVLVGLSLPRYWLGVMLLFVFALKMSWFPLGGYGRISHLVLPALTVGMTGAAYYARLMRSSMIDVKRQDYVLTARSKGISQTRVMIYHVMRNSLIPVTTWAGIDLASFLGGMVITETVFGWPGIGQLTFQAIQNIDIPLIMGTVLFSATIVVLASLVVDLAYLFLDPRISYE
jgi:peptide/nickel transport system permease protein